MEILKDTPEKEYVAKCHRCETVLKFKESEAKFVDDYREPFVEVTCPVCGNRVCKTV
jgi:predicted RNA-binding Zn-ribbon protein involved in translation (DUF1610 family)